MSEARRPPRSALTRGLADAAWWLWRRAEHLATIRADSRQAARFAKFGAATTIAFPPAVLHGVERIELGNRITIGPQATLSAGMFIPLDDGRDPLLSISDGCVFGKGLSIVAHERIEIGADTVAGHYVYITDQNHGYTDISLPIGKQLWKNSPVKIGADCWLGHGSIVLPGARIGRHVVVAAGSVVLGDIPDFCVVAGAPARVVRRYVEGEGWLPVPRG